APWSDRHFPGLYCSISRSEFEQVHVRRSKSQAWDRRKRSSDAEITRASNDLIYAHLLSEPCGCRVDRFGERLGQRHAAIAVIVKILRTPPLNVDRARIDGIVGPKPLAQGR